MVKIYNRMFLTDNFKNGLDKSDLKISLKKYCKNRKITLHKRGRMMTRMTCKTNDATSLQPSTTGL